MEGAGGLWKFIREDGEGEVLNLGIGDVLSEWASKKQHSSLPLPVLTISRPTQETHDILLTFPEESNKV